MEEMTLGQRRNDTPSSQAAGPQYVLSRAEEGERKSEGHDVERSAHKAEGESEG